MVFVLLGTTLRVCTVGNVENIEGAVFESCSTHTASNIKGPFFLLDVSLQGYMLSWSNDHSVVCFFFFFFFSQALLEEMQHYIGDTQVNLTEKD